MTKSRNKCLSALIDRRRQFEGSRRQVPTFCDKAVQQVNPSLMVDLAERRPAAMERERAAVRCTLLGHVFIIKILGFRGHFTDLTFVR